MGPQQAIHLALKLGFKTIIKAGNTMVEQNHSIILSFSNLFPVDDCGFVQLSKGLLIKGRAADVAD